MADGRASYEVQRFRTDHWVLDEIRETESMARNLAKKLLADKQVEGVRIVRNWQRSDGILTENVVFEEKRTVDAGPVRIVPIETAPICHKPPQYYQLEARLTIGRLLRNYLEKLVLTPTELLHSYKELRRVQEADTMFPAAVDRVATIQARQERADSRVRRDELYHTIDQMTARARRAEKETLPDLKDRNVGRMLRRVDNMAHDADDRDYYAKVVLAKDLSGCRTWLGKFERLMDLAQPEQPPEAVTLLDGVVADVLAAPVLQEVLGWQPNLAAAVCRMVDLTEGGLPIKDGRDDDGIGTLNRLFAAGQLPAACATVYDRLQRQLKSAQPLQKADADHEEKALRQVVLRLTLPDGLIGGPETAEALTVRYGRFVEAGGLSGRRQSIAGMMKTLPDARARVCYLLTLRDAPMGKDHEADIMTHLHTLLSPQRIDDVVPKALSPKDKMLFATGLHGVVSRSSLPDTERVQLADGLDGLLERYLIDNKIIEKLDDAESQLRDRATRLVNFCGSGVLPEGRAVKLARSRILDILRQPNFDEVFVQGIGNAADAQRALRDFHQLLGKAGFR